MHLFSDYTLFYSRKCDDRIRINATFFLILYGGILLLSVNLEVQSIIEMMHRFCVSGALQCSDTCKEV